MSLPVSKTAQAPSAAVDIQIDECQYLTFSLEKEMYAIGILSIKEILEYGQLTTVPMMPVFIRGVINLRGAVVPVVDLAARFGGKPREISKRTCIVIVEVTTGETSQVIGVVVDAVSEVLEIPVGEIEPPPAFGAPFQPDFIAGMGKVNNSFVIILDVNKVLSVEELEMASRISEEAQSE